MKALRIIFSLLGAFLILYFLLREIDVEDILMQIAEVKWGFLAVGFGLYFFINLIRSYRFYVLVDKKIGIAAFLPITFIHNFFNIILPFRSGELSYFYLLRKYTSVGFGHALFSLIIARLFDFLSIMSIVMASLIFFVAESFYVGQIFYAVFSIFFAAAAVFLIVVRWGDSLLFWSIRFLGNRGPFKSKLTDFFLKKLEELRSAFIIFKRRGVVARLALASFLIWVLIFAMGWFLFRSVGINLPFTKAAVAYAFPVIISVSPFQLFGGFGSFEGSVTAGFLLFDIPVQFAIASGVILHFQELIFNLVLAVAGFGALGVKRIKLLV